eukprot:scaffold12879_cov15-Tisochrysis_lutea.AAC.2
MTSSHYCSRLEVAENKAACMKERPNNYDFMQLRKSPLYSGLDPAASAWGQLLPTKSHVSESLPELPFSPILLHK